MNRTSLHAVIKEAIRDTAATTASLDFLLNDSIRPFLRQLIDRKAWGAFSYIPRVTIPLTADDYEYNTFKTTEKVAECDADSVSSGVYTDASQAFLTTSYVCAGDILRENNATDYNIIAVTNTTLRVDSTAPSSTTYEVKPGIFEVISARYKATGDDYYRTLNRSRAAFQIDDYDRGIVQWNDRMYRIEGDTLWLNWLPDAGTLDLFYIPLPLTFSSTLTDTNVPNPTNLSDEVDRALCWYCGERHWRMIGNDKEAERCQYSKLEHLNGLLSTGAPAWNKK